MHGCFIELPAFERVRERYLNDAAYSKLQDLLLLEPELRHKTWQGQAKRVTGHLLLLVGKGRILALHCV